MTGMVRFEMELTFNDFFETTRFIMDSPMMGNSIMVDPADVYKIDMAGVLLLVSGGAEC